MKNFSKELRVFKLIFLTLCTLSIYIISSMNFFVSLSVKRSANVTLFILIKLNYFCKYFKLISNHK